MKRPPASQASSPIILAASGFSLVEVVIALGIVSFAVVAVVGMLPMGLKTAKDSMFDTDATLAAQRLFSEMLAGSGVNRAVSTGATDSATVPLDGNSAIAILGFTSDGKPMLKASTLDANPAVDFFARISVSTNTGVPRLTQVQVDVSRPAAAPPAGRSTNSFTTLIAY